MHRNSTWNGGWHLATHNSGEPPNGHDFLLHRRHKAQPREVSLRLTAALFEDEGVTTPPSCEARRPTSSTFSAPTEPSADEGCRTL